MILHQSDVTMVAMAYQITNLTIVYSSIYSGADQRKHQSSASQAFVRWPMNSPHKGPVTRKMIPFNDVITSVHNMMQYYCVTSSFELISMVDNTYTPHYVLSDQIGAMNDDVVGILKTFVWVNCLFLCCFVSWINRLPLGDWHKEKNFLSWID